MPSAEAVLGGSGQEIARNQERYRKDLLRSLNKIPIVKTRLGLRARKGEINCTTSASNISLLFECNSKRASKPRDKNVETNFEA